MHRTRVLQRRTARLTIVTLAVAVLLVAAGFAGYGLHDTDATGGTMAGAGTAAATIPPAPANLTQLPLPAVAPPVGDRGPELVKYNITVKEVVAQLDDGVAYTYWTYNGTVPGPMMRVRVGDTVQVTLNNPAGNSVTHSIDMHAAAGPGGGSAVMQVAPGESKTIQFIAETPGVFVYHCATPPAAMHIAMGMFGLIVVEPAGGLPTVDHEYYVMESEFYIEGSRGQPGLHQMSMDKLLAETPDYDVFNGSVDSLNGTRALQATTGQTVRIFFGDAGPNEISSFHVIGQVMTRVAPYGAIASPGQPSEYMTNVQTILVPAGGAIMAELTPTVPGDYTLVDHSLSRVLKGGSATLHVTGSQLDPNSFKVVQPGS